MVDLSASGWAIVIGFSLIKKIASQFEGPDGHHNTKVRGSETEMRHFRAFETRHYKKYHVMRTKHFQQSFIVIFRGS